MNRLVSLWFDDRDGEELVIGDADWNTNSVPTSEERRIVRVDIERENGARFSIGVVRADNLDEDEFRVDALPSGYSLVINATTNGSPLIGIFSEPGRADVYVVFATALGELRWHVGSCAAATGGQS